MQRWSRAKRLLYTNALYDFQPAILLTNKKINNEAHRFLYNHNLFVLVRYPPTPPLDALLTGEIAPLPVKEDEVHCSLSSSRLSLCVDIHVHDLVDEELNNFLVEPGFVMAANELGILCKILVRLDQEFPGFLTRLNLKLGIFAGHQLIANASATTESSSPLVWKSRPSPEQRMLLEPFSTLHSVKNFDLASMDGKTECIDAQLMKDVKERAGRLSPSMEEVAVTASKLEDQGNEAFRAGDFLHACVLYRSAWGNLKGWIYYHHRAFSIDQPEFNEGNRARVQVGLRIRSSLVAALLRLQLWSEAHMSAAEEIKAMVDTRTFGSVYYYDLRDVAKLYYLGALASEGMGKLTQAVKEIREAMRCDPNNTEMKATFDEWVKSAK